MVIDKGYGELLKLVKKMLPKDNELPATTYEAKLFQLGGHYMDKLRRSLPTIPLGGPRHLYGRLVDSLGILLLTYCIA